MVIKESLVRDLLLDKRIGTPIAKSLFTNCRNNINNSDKLHTSLINWTKTYTSLWRYILQERM